MQNLALKILAAITYVAMITVNYLSNSLPINNRGTGEISDAYPNLFAPTGLTFAIWGLIYLLLGGYVIYQFTEQGRKRDALIKKINLFFIITSLANISWIFAWHYDFIGLSVIIMTVLLVGLIKLADILHDLDGKKTTSLEKLFLSTPFSIYFGWITVAAIANITVFLVSIGWNGFGIPDFVWTIIILFVGALIGILRILKDKKIPYGLVLIWAYIGILIKHLSESGFNQQYPLIIAAVVICLALFGFFVGKIAYKK